uniref:Uncharacterized protein n=1 Tax=Candidatus Kentrum sp. FM TaxID=2126340 RepID=A0A450SAC8_9GAMM|nr:MAG: hypothetical protein BECKFM1743A_GA0114220_100656 [Candidatus Kentron sp. FM]VFJ49361.1 MAG: hypothetical protein BECKFM1743C_GA0114222_100706 [Candidatus Kentron sp. FM]VFK08269.1 MAG: hypothetical protein BECKFM1743B_GA0114221_100646 [Candidatus Kentron sp. FM]
MSAKREIPRVGLWFYAWNFGLRQGFDRGSIGVSPRLWLIALPLALRVEFRPSASFHPTVKMLLAQGQKDL